MPLSPYKQALLDNSQDLIANVMSKLEEANEDLIMLLCDCESKDGLAMAKLSYEFNEKAGQNLYIYALEKELFIKMMLEAGANDVRSKVRKGEIGQLVLFSHDQPHYFVIERPGQRHWASFTGIGRHDETCNSH